MSNRSSPEVRVTNTHLPTIRWLQRKFGGTVFRWKTVKVNCRRTYQWGIRGAHAVFLCEWLLPFLREKRPQAELLIRASFTPKADRERLLKPLRKLKKISFD